MWPSGAEGRIDLYVEHVNVTSMKTNASSHSRSPDERNEAFWESLFAQEQKIDVEQAVSHSPPASLPRPKQNTPSSAPTPPADPWQLAQKYMDEDRVVRLRVEAFNKGGLIVYWQGLQGFVPASQLLECPQFHLEHRRMQRLKQWLNEWLTLKIIEVKPEANRLIFSERATQVDADEREQLFAAIEPGDRITGTITNLTDFGAFVDLGGVEGLVHISELSWSRVPHPSKIVEPGQQVEVKVLKVEPNNGRIALSCKRLKENPWRGVAERYHPGQIVTGTVSDIAGFGAFVLLEEELEGLIHVSELAEGDFLHPRNVVRPGDRVQARVLHVDGAKKRLALSLRDIPNAIDP